MNSEVYYLFSWFQSNSEDYENFFCFLVFNWNFGFLFIIINEGLKLLIYI